MRVAEVYDFFQLTFSSDSEVFSLTAAAAALSGTSFTAGPSQLHDVNLLQKTLNWLPSHPSLTELHDDRFELQVAIIDLYDGSDGADRLLPPEPRPHAPCTPPPALCLAIVPSEQLIQGASKGLIS